MYIFNMQVTPEEVHKMWVLLDNELNNWGPGAQLQLMVDEWLLTPQDYQNQIAEELIFTTKFLYVINQYRKRGMYLDELVDVLKELLGK